MRGFIVEHSCVQVTDKHNKPIERLNDIEILEQITIQITVTSGQVVTGAFRKVFLKENNPKFHFHERKILKLSQLSDFGLWN